MPSTLVPSDEALARAVRDGDRRAFARLVERHYPVLLACCRRMTGDSDLARDASQEAVLRAMLGMHRLRDDRSFGAWLVGIGLNVCRSLTGLRRREAPLEVAPREPEAREADPAVRFQAAELATRIRGAIAELPAGQREAVALFYLAGLTHAEIAEEVGSRPGAIKTRLHKARTTLRGTLRDLREEQPYMSAASPDLVPMRVAELRRTAPDGQKTLRHVLFLDDEAGQRRLPIWIGAVEAAALAIQLDEVELPRPSVYQLAASLLSAGGSALHEVRITELTGSVFYAQALLADGAVVDARPSDAITLALLTGAPIYVHSTVLEQSDSQREALGDLLSEADSATDDARTLADEVRALLQETAREVADHERRSR